MILYHIHNIHIRSLQCKRIFPSFTFWTIKEKKVLYCRIILNIVPKNPDGYSAQSAVIHMFGYAPTGARPKQDGVRSDFVHWHSDYWIPSFFLLISCSLYLNPEFTSSLEAGLLSVSSSKGWRWMGWI